MRIINVSKRVNKSKTNLTKLCVLRPRDSGFSALKAKITNFQTRFLESSFQMFRRLNTNLSRSLVNCFQVLVGRMRLGEYCWRWRDSENTVGGGDRNTTNCKNFVLPLEKLSSLCSWYLRNILLFMRIYVKMQPDVFL